MEETQELDTLTPIKREDFEDTWTDAIHLAKLLAVSPNKGLLKECKIKFEILDNRLVKILKESNIYTIPDVYQHEWKQISRIWKSKFKKAEFLPKLKESLNKTNLQEWF